MEENGSGDGDDNNTVKESIESCDNEQNENAKRLKTDMKVDEFEVAECNTVDGKESKPSTSSNNCFPKAKTSKNRNYRKSKDEESSANESEKEEVQQDLMEVTDVTEDANSTTDCDTKSETTVHSDSSVINNMDSDDDVAPLKKPKPKHNWFLVPEVMNRQIGTSAKFHSDELFQRRCYGSLHSVQRLELMHRLDKHEGCVNCLNFHPNGSLLASGSDDLKVILWDWHIGKDIFQFETKHRGNVFQCKFLPLSGSDLHIVTCARDGQVRLAQIATEGLKSSRKLGSHKAPCHKLTILKDQPQIILSAGEDCVVLNHDLRCSKPEKVVTVKSDEKEVALYSISSHPLDTNEFCVCGRDYMVRTYDKRMAEKPLKIYHPFKKPHVYTSYHITCAVYNHNGSEILASYNDEDVYLFDVKASEPGTFVHQYSGHKNTATIKGVHFFGPKSEFVISGSDCGYLYIWDRNTEGIVQWMLADDNRVVNCLEPHPQIPFLCTSGLDYDVKVWVPSCEQEPSFSGLTETVNSNTKRRSHWADCAYDFDNRRMLWMLWRRLSRSEQMRRASHMEMENNDDNSSTDTDSEQYSESDNSDNDDSDGPAGCMAS